MRHLRISILVICIFVAQVFLHPLARGQMSTEEATKRMKESEQAAANAPSTRISLEDLSILKSAIQKLNKQKTDLETQMAALKSRAPGNVQVGWTLDQLNKCSWLTVQDTRQALDVQLNGNLTPGVPGQRVTITTTTVVQPPALVPQQQFIQGRNGNGVIVNQAPPPPAFQNNRTSTLRQLERYTLTVNTGAGNPASAFKSVNALIDVDTHTITQLDAANGTVGAPVAPVSAALPQSVPTTADEQVMLENKTLREQLAPQQAQYAKLQDQLKQQQATAAQVTSQLAQAQQDNQKLQNELQQAQQQPAVVPVAETPAPAPTGWSIQLNSKNMFVGAVVLLAIIVIAIKIAAR